ncbi:hypothetical protein M434DRAFT_17091, partial [Hypoxylon sp. CO27-5]
AAEGGIVRGRLSEEAYELKFRYSSTGRNDSTQEAELKATLDHDMRTIVRFVQSVLPTPSPPASAMDEIEDIFTHGLDFAQTLEIAVSLKRNLPSHVLLIDWTPVNIVATILGDLVPHPKTKGFDLVKVWSLSTLLGATAQHPG